MLLLCSFGGKKGAELKNLTAEQYNNLVDNEELVLIDFYSPGCQYCKQLSPNIDKIEEVYKGKLKVIRINVAENKFVSDMMNIKSIPTVYLYKNNKAVWNFTGYIEKYPLSVYVRRHLN